MQAKLLTDEDFRNIAAFHTVTEVAAYLKEHPGYRNVLADMDENRLHRGEIEKLLVQSLYSDYTRLYRFSGMDQKKFLELYLKRYEMNLINYCLRIVFNHYQKPFDLDHKKIFFDKYSDLSIDKLITSGNIGELVENLKGTEYYAPLKRLENAENPTLFDYDLALNLYYFTTMWKKRKKILKHKELEIFTRDAGSKDRPAEPAVDLPCKKILQHASAGYLYTADPGTLPDPCRSAEGSCGSTVCR